MIYSVPNYQQNEIYSSLSEIIDWGGRYISPLWTFSKGKGVKVCILDSGYTEHPDLVGAISATKDFTNTSIDAVFPHGNYVAGIIGARENSLGFVGVAPESELFIAKVLNNNGQATTQTIIKGIEWGIKENVDIFNMSFGTFKEDLELHSCIKEAALSGFIFVAAAGNEGPWEDTINYPAKWDEVVSVGAIKENREIAIFSSRGKKLDILAPGENILTLGTHKNYLNVSGTSFACPFISGLMSLLPNKNKEELLKLCNGDNIIDPITCYL